MKLRLALCFGLALAQLATLNSQLATSADPGLTKDLEAILANGAVARALVGVRIESLRTGEVLFQRNNDKLVVPASNMKLLTMSVAAERLGWQDPLRDEARIGGPD